MESVADLYKKFNFTSQALFSIGHSITGTAIKGVSLLTDIQEIVFEASDSQNNVNFLKSQVKLIVKSQTFIHKEQYLLETMKAVT